jgi:hypothetical protein
MSAHAGIQYSVTPELNIGAAEILDHPLSRMMSANYAGRLRKDAIESAVHFSSGFIGQKEVALIIAVLL